MEAAVAKAVKAADLGKAVAAGKADDSLRSSRKQSIYYSESGEVEVVDLEDEEVRLLVLITSILILYYILYFIYYTLYYILYTIYYILYTIYYILYTIYYILYTIYYILYTIYYILYA
jgi:hypothetical protein